MAEPNTVALPCQHDDHGRCTGFTLFGAYSCSCFCHHRPEQTPEQAIDDLTNQLAVAMSRLGAVATVVGEAVDGYRAGLVARGYSAEDASRMAADYHRWVFVQITKGGEDDDARGEGT